MDLIASITETRCSGPRTWPLRVTRFTWLNRTMMELGRATGASWCWVNGIPLFNADAAGEMREARSGPSTESRCQSPQ